MSVKPEEIKEKTETRSTHSEKLVVNDYLYHSIGGFDLYKIDSIAKYGILSLDKARQKGIITGAIGMGENVSTKVSVSTSDVLTENSYAGVHLSFIIDPSNLTVANLHDVPPQYIINDGFILNVSLSAMLQGSDSSDCPTYERQIKGEVPTNSIVGIMIPDCYLESKLDDLSILNPKHPNKLIYNINILNLMRFFMKHAMPAMLKDQSVQELYIVGNFIKNNSIKDKISKCAVHALNKAMMGFIIREYKKLLCKNKINFIDIINFHLKGKYPIYNTQGKLLNSDMLKISSIDYQSSHVKKLELLNFQYDQLRDYLLKNSSNLTVDVQYSLERELDSEQAYLQDEISEDSTGNRKKEKSSGDVSKKPADSILVLRDHMLKLDEDEAIYSYHTYGKSLCAKTERAIKASEFTVSRKRGLYIE